jgi:hypothetical protein
MKKYVLLVLFLLVTACATTEKYEAKLQSWIGADEETLLMEWGPPDSVYDINDTKKMLTYLETSVLHIAGSAPRYTTEVIGGVMHTRVTGGTEPRDIERKCKTTFVIENGEVVDWIAKGNNCVSQ